MFEWIKENSIAFSIAVILHLLFIGALLFNWEFDKPRQIVLKQGDIIQTTAVDANSFNSKIAEIEQQKKAQQQRKATAERKAREAKEKKRQEEKRKKAAKKQAAQKRKEQAARKKELQRKAAQLEEKKKQEKKRKEQKLKEEQRKQAEKKAAEQKRIKEARQKAEQEKRQAEEKKRRIAEQKRQAEADKKRQAELKRQQQREQAERERRSKGIVNKYVGLIAQKIERNWRRPPDTAHNLQCKIDIVLRSNGQVISAKIAESSGNASFDHSVETAVLRASPLPVPADSVIFKQFKEMRLRFEPGSY